MKTKDKIKISGFIYIFVVLGSILSLAGIIFAQYKPTSKSVDLKDLWKKRMDELVIKIPSTENWKEYVNNWYGFKLKYPEAFGKIKKEAGAKNDPWEYKYDFLKDNFLENEEYLGFEVTIYNLEEIKELSETSEFPKRRESFARADDFFCLTVEDNIDKIENLEMEEIYVSPKNNCYHQAFFFTIIRGEYIYNVVPITKDSSLAKDKEKITKNFPEFLGFVSSFNLTDIRRVPIIVKPKITAPMPVSYKIENGRLVCAKKHDKPSKSKKDKDKHLDMECCLDPDEYPNPHCYYDPVKYGKYLK